MSFATQNRRDVYLGKRACKTCTHCATCFYVHGDVDGGCGPGLPKWGGQPHPYPASQPSETDTECVCGICPACIAEMATPMPHERATDGGEGAKVRVETAKALMHRIDALADKVKRLANHGSVAQHNSQHSKLKARLAKIEERLPVASKLISRIDALERMVRKKWPHTSRTIAESTTEASTDGGTDD